MTVIGSKTEGALLRLARDWGVDDEEVRRLGFDSRTDKIIPFSSVVKSSSAIVRLKREGTREGGGTGGGGVDISPRYRLFCKGTTRESC